MLATWLKIPSPEVVELMALAGFDAVVIDLEHAPLSLESTHALIGTALGAGISPVVRVPNLDGAVVQRVLDSGAEGIVVPHVDSVAEAEAAVRAVRFPPVGTRGVGSTGRAGLWGARSRADYLRFGQEEVVLVVQIESAHAARDAGAIASVAGVDALLVGAADLSVSMGHTESDGEVVELVADVVEQARTAGVPVGNAGGSGRDAVQAAADRGFTFTVMSNDASMLGATARTAVDAARTVRPR